MSGGDDRPDCGFGRAQTEDRVPMPRTIPFLGDKSGYERASILRTVRLLGCITVLALVSACASHTKLAATQEAATYAARAKADYTAPGPAEDPWGPYIIEAAVKYDVPERWVRGVIRQESGGRLYEHGTLITSPVGAMGLMQVMPGTYDELRARYSLGDDPYDPHNNILAGTAYIRELYDVYGAPGFLAAYNAGPRRLDDYLSHNRSLPDETRNYVARIAPGIMGIDPAHVSPAQMLAMNQLPMNIPSGPRYPRSRAGQPVALALNRGRRVSGYDRVEVASATLPEPPRMVAAPRQAQQFAALQPPSKSGRGGFHLIGSAMADTLPVSSGGSTAGGWAIQVGAFGNEGQARGAADAARGQAREMLASAHPLVGAVHQAHGTLYRARLVGLSRSAAVQACEKIAHGRNSCIVLSPDAQS